MNTSEVLNKAADLIEERGWATGPGAWYDNREVGLCLEGGIIAAQGIDITDWNNDGELLWSCPAYLAVANYLGYDVTNRDDDGAPAEPVWRYNDQTSAEQVIATLRAAAVIEAAKENAEIEVSA